MKIFKKMVALTAMAAVCFTMSAPITASAATRAAGPGLELPSCPPHNFVRGNDRYEEYDTTHEYVFGYADRDGDGYAETVMYATCYVHVVIDEYDLICTDCGMTLPEEGPGRVETHTNPNC